MRKKIFEEDPNADMAQIAFELAVHIHTLRGWTYSFRKERRNVLNELILSLADEHEPCAPEQIAEGIECDGSGHSLREMEFILPKHGFFLKHNAIWHILNSNPKQKKSTTPTKSLSADDIAKHVLGTKTVSAAKRIITKVIKEREKEFLKAKKLPMSKIVEKLKKVTPVSPGMIIFGLKKKINTQARTIRGLKYNIKRLENQILDLRKNSMLVTGNDNPNEQIKCNNCGAYLNRKTILVKAVSKQ